MGKELRSEWSHFNVSCTFWLKSSCRHRDDTSWYSTEKFAIFLNEGYRQRSQWQLGPPESVQTHWKERVSKRKSQILYVNSATVCTTHMGQTQSSVWIGIEAATHSRCDQMCNLSLTGLIPRPISKEQAEKNR